MPVIFMVFLLGTVVNVANDHPKNIAGVEASLEKQIKNPVISPATVYNK